MRSEGVLHLFPLQGMIRSIAWKIEPTKEVVCMKKVFAFLKYIVRAPTPEPDYWCLETVLAVMMVELFLRNIQWVGWYFMGLAVFGMLLILILLRWRLPLPPKHPWLRNANVVVIVLIILANIGSIWVFTLFHIMTPP